MDCSGCNCSSCDNVTPIFYIECFNWWTVGECLDGILNSNGESFAGVDTNRIATLVAGRPRLGGPLGPMAIVGQNYTYDELYVESDVKLRAEELE